MVHCLTTQHRFTDNVFFIEYQLVRIIGDLFTAGTETTATTLLWGLTYMMRNPEVQREVQKEIIEVLGPDQCPSYQDREKMPYTEATLLEIQVGQRNISSLKIRLVSY